MKRLVRALAYEVETARHVSQNNRPWIVIVEPDSDASLLVIVAAYEVSE
jgi:hypothetical protein